MTDEKKGEKSLASELDDTHWDYQPRKDRNFLLAPLARLFSSIAWEFRPKHLAPAPVLEETEIETETPDGDEAAPGDTAESPDQRR